MNFSYCAQPRFQHSRGIDVDHGADTFVSTCRNVVPHTPKNSAPVHPRSPQAYRAPYPDRTGADPNDLDDARSFVAALTWALPIGLLLYALLIWCLL